MPEGTLPNCPYCGKPGHGKEYHTPAAAKTSGRGTPSKPLASSIGGVCPKCGGTSFKPVRSTGRKLALGFASLLTSANEVQCVTCGKKFKRG